MPLTVAAEDLEGSHLLVLTKMRDIGTYIIRIGPSTAYIDPKSMRWPAWVVLRQSDEGLRILNELK